MKHAASVEMIFFLAQLMLESKYRSWDENSVFGAVLCNRTGFRNTHCDQQAWNISRYIQNIACMLVGSIIAGVVTEMIHDHVCITDHVLLINTELQYSRHVVVASLPEKA